MSQSYKSKMSGTKYGSYVKRVVSQPTQQSNIKTKMDPKSPTGISEDKRK
jgi:hypothetical protein